MNRCQLEHIIRASCGNADTADIVVIGSQSILGSYPDAPEELLTSMEADVYPLDAPENSILIDGAIGEKSIFHETFGYYAHGVGPETAVLPEGWRERLVAVTNENTRGTTGWCLEPNDLAVSKLVAGREKDLEWLGILLSKGMASATTIRTRLDSTPISASSLRELALARLNRLEKSSSRPPPQPKPSP
ncbi:MAG: DUF6036 family nucleotidyltransferase [Kiritimatiellia bacterium]